MHTKRVGRLAPRIRASAVCGSWMRPASRSGDSRRPPPAGCGGIVLGGPMGRCVGMQLGRDRYYSNMYRNRTPLQNVRRADPSFDP